MKILFCLFFVIVFQLTSCSQANLISELSNNRWKAVEILGKDISSYESIEEEAYLNFKNDGELSGSTSCNTFSGSYKAEGNSITLDVSTMTKMMCYGSAELDFLQALRQTTKFTLEGQNLYLLNATKVVMKLTQ